MMPEGADRALAGAPAADDRTQTSIVPPRQKNGRTRYLRFFPERATFLLDRLDDRQFVAAFRLTLEFVIRNGVVGDDDVALARITKLSKKSWLELKALLLEVGVGRVEDGRWIDDDQQTSLDLQNAMTERQRAVALSRWRKHHA